MDAPAAMLVAALLTASPVAQASPLEARYQALKQAESAIYDPVSGRKDASALREAWRRDFAARDIANAGTADLLVMHAAAGLLAFHVPQEPYLGQLLATLEVLLARDAAPAGEVRDAVGVLIAARDWQAAASWNGRLPAGERIVIPAFVDATEGVGGPTLMTLERGADAWALVRRPASGMGHRIVVVATPACGFSRRMFDDAADDTDLSALLATASIVVPPSPSLLLDEVHAWNAAHPSLAMAYAWNDAEWSPVALWQTPAIVFLDGSRVVEQVVGWKGAETRAAAIDAHERFRKRITSP